MIYRRGEPNNDFNNQLGCSLTYFEFAAHDFAPSWHRDVYDMESLVPARVSLQGITRLDPRDGAQTIPRNEFRTAAALGFETLPDLSTLWGTWHE